MASAIQAGLGLGGVALPHELRGQADFSNVTRTHQELRPRRPERPVLPDGALAGPSDFASAPSPTTTPTRTTHAKPTRPRPSQAVTSDMISSPVVASRVEAVSAALEPTAGWSSKPRSAGSYFEQQPSGLEGEESATMTPLKRRPPPIKTTSSSSSSGTSFLSPLRQRFGSIGLSKDKNAKQSGPGLSPTSRDAAIEDIIVQNQQAFDSFRKSETFSPSEPVPPTWRERPTGPSAHSPLPRSTSAGLMEPVRREQRPTVPHRRAISDSPMFASGNFVPIAGAASRISTISSSTRDSSADRLYLSAGDGIDKPERHFGSVPLTADAGAVIKLRSSLRPDELELGWICVPGVDSNGQPFTMWEIRLRPRQTSRPVSAVSRAETARLPRSPDAQSLHNYSMQQTPMAPQPVLPLSDDFHPEETPVSPTRPFARSRKPSERSEGSSYGSISSEVSSSWAGPMDRQRGKMSVSSAATSAAEECYSPIDLTAYGVQGEDSPDFSYLRQSVPRSASYVPGVASFERARQFSIDPVAEAKTRSMSLSQVKLGRRQSYYVEGYDEDLSIDSAPVSPAPQPNRAGTLKSSNRTSGILPIKVSLDRTSHSTTRSKLPSPLSQRRFDILQASTKTAAVPRDNFVGPPLCPLPDLPPVHAERASLESPSPSFSMSLDGSDAEDLGTASIELVQQRRTRRLGSRWSDEED